MARTDERIDDAMLRIDRSLESLRDEMHAEFRSLRAEVGAGQRQMTMIGWGIAAALLAQLIAFVITQS